MGALGRREREKAAFREDVLKAARRIVLEQGFEGLTIRKIADSIEYAPGTIYLYFKNRDEIAAELTQAASQEMLDAFAPAAGIADPAERLYKVGELYARFGFEHPESYRLMFMTTYSDEVFNDEAADSAGDRALQFLMRAFDELREQGRLASTATSAQLADTFWAAMHGVVSLKLACKDYPQTPTDDLVRIMRDVTLRGVLTH